jgi:inorganic pyrophosphatase
MLDGGVADDKIIAVLNNDGMWNQVRQLSELPTSIIDRLRHYFTTYKTLANEKSSVSVGEPYGYSHAISVVNAAMEDYTEMYGE